MLVKIGALKVDVLDKACPSRPCCAVGFDKGTYAQGRGYTSYYEDRKTGRRVEKPVCMTRHLHGCPTPSVCGSCRTLSVRQPGEKCDHCEGGELMERKF